MRDTQKQFFAEKTLSLLYQLHSACVLYVLELT